MADLGGGCRGCAPLPEMTCGLVFTFKMCLRHKSVTPFLSGALWCNSGSASVNCLFILFIYLFTGKVKMMYLGIFVITCISFGLVQSDKGNVWPYSDLIRIACVWGDIPYVSSIDSCSLKCIV